MVVGYVRVSSVDQNPERQIEMLKQYQVQKLFTEKISGKNMDRPKLKEMLGFVREGDTIVISEYSRMARSASDLLQIVELLKNKNVILISLKENLNTSTPQGRFMLTVFAGLAELERETILERQREGIAIAKSQGKYKGRPPNHYDEKLLMEVLIGVHNKTMTVTKAAQKLGVTRATIYNLMKREGQGDFNGCNEV